MTRSSSPSLSRSPAWLPWSLLVAVWLPLLVRLARMWRSETEQYFGFGVPLLVGWLLWERRGEWLGASARAGGAGWLLAAGAIAFAVALPALEANPLWPGAAWLGATGVLALTLALIARGQGWRSAGLAAPVLVLLLTALKWPTFIHEPVMRTMMQLNARIAAEVVSLSGTPAVVQGNVIEVARGLVGVDEACSGLRSLQTVIMMALFLGEFGRLGLGRRVALLAGAVLAALLANVARTSVLTAVFARAGAATEDRWHDPAGATALVITLVLVWAWSERLSSGVVQSAAKNPPVFQWLAWRPLLAGVALVAVVELGTQAWYRAHEQTVQPRVSWKLAPAAGAGWTPVGVPRRSADILRYQSGEAFGRELPAPVRPVLAFVFRWESDLARLGLPELHDPLVCLPSVGAVREAELPIATVNVEGVVVPFRFIRFRQGDVSQHVWFCLWNTRSAGADAAHWRGGDPAIQRWRRVRAGVRDDEREQLVFFVQGSRSDAEAAAALRDAVLTLLRRE